MESYYNIFESLPNNRKFFYLVLSTFLFFVISRSIIHISHIFGLMIVLVVVGWLMSHDVYNSGTLGIEKLDYLNTLLYTDSYTNINDEFYVRPVIHGSHLEKSPEVIDFYYRLKDYANYNLPSYRKSLLNANTLLGIEEQINHLDYASKNPKHILDFAEREYKEALNNLHSLIFSIPSTRITNYIFNNALKNLEYILIQHLDNIKNLAKLNFDNCEINNNSQPIHDYHASYDDRGDPGYSQNFSMY